ncbi:MAG: F0F1 ATP synthase subunit B [Alphaproteobacteria bacterium]|nr:F0F1 ATP synthase subunit B [Alphaproteobacteria bacterium]
MWRTTMRFSRSATVTGLTVALSAAFSTVAAAEGEMPQMNFANPLTFAQVVWMAAIMIVLYVLMARWALPRIGTVIENRKRRIDDDLDAAMQARTEANRVIAELERAIREAHAEGRAAIAGAMNDAKDKARIEEDALKARLEADLAHAKEEIEQTRRAAVAVIRPVADDVVRTLVERLTGRPAERAAIDRALDAVQR